MLNEKEMQALKDLKDQEKCCIEKYDFYANSAKDPELKDLFTKIKKHEQEHFDTLIQVMNGDVPSCDINCSLGKDYQPTGSYSANDNTDDKKHGIQSC